MVLSVCDIALCGPHINSGFLQRSSLFFMPHSQRPALSGLLLAAAGAIAFSGKAIIVKLSYLYGVDAVTVIMYRMLFALPFFIAMGLWAEQVSYTRPTPTPPPAWG